MGLYHSVTVAYGFELPRDTDIDLLDQVIGDTPDLGKDRVGHLVVGDRDQLLLVTRYVQVKENEVKFLAPDAIAQPDETTAWNAALAKVASRLGYTAHPQPGWLVVHNHR